MNQQAGKFILIAIASAAMMSWVKGYEDIVTLWYEEADARVVSFTQEPASSSRGGDWNMTYEYQAKDGLTYSGRCQYAPKNHPPADIQRTKIRYFPPSPSISRPADHLSATGLAGYAISVFSLVLAAKSIRLARKQQTPAG
jgi:hypothetical protein